MKTKNDEILPTRASLLHRLRDVEDDRSWKEFFDTYWKLIYGVARKTGLSDAEAQDVVQETFMSVAKNIPNFQYDPAKGSFKAWLLNATRWRIYGQFRKRQPGADKSAENDNLTDRTSTIQGIADPNSLVQDNVWDEEWQRQVLAKAMANIQRKVDPHRFQIFDCYVNKEWPAEKVAASFGITADQVYQIKCRMTETLKEEVQRIEREVTSVKRTPSSPAVK